MLTGRGLLWLYAVLAVATRLSMADAGGPPQPPPAPAAAHDAAPPRAPPPQAPGSAAAPEASRAPGDGHWSKVAKGEGFTITLTNTTNPNITGYTGKGITAELRRNAETGRSESAVDAWSFKAGPSSDSYHEEEMVRQLLNRQTAKRVCKGQACACKRQRSGGTGAGS